MWEEVYNVCERVYGAKEVTPGGVRVLQTFQGYTVDFRLREFRALPTKGPPQFIDFLSNEGVALVDEMYEAAIRILLWFANTAIILNKGRETYDTATITMGNMER